MTGKRQAEKLMNELLGFAEKMLNEYGEFHPFGGYLKASGAMVHVGAKDGGAQQKVSSLIESFKHLAMEGKGVAFGIVVDVKLPNDDGTKGDAIKFLLEHKDGYCAEVFFRYEIRLEGNVEITDTIALQGEPWLFTMVH